MESDATNSRKRARTEGDDAHEAVEKVHERRGKGTILDEHQWAPVPVYPGDPLLPPDFDAVSSQHSANNGHHATSADQDNQQQQQFFYFQGKTPLFLTPQVPKAAYRSRGVEVKSVIHWGQRKLFLSELQLLTYFAEPYQSYWIVYVGAAPGSHLIFLNDLFSKCRHEWELIDPGTWDNRLTATAQVSGSAFTLRNEFFDNDTAYELFQRRLVKARCPGLSRIYETCIELGKRQPPVPSSSSSLGTATSTGSASNVPIPSPSSSSVLPTKVTDGLDADTARTEDIPIKYVQPIEIPQHGLSLLLKVSAERCKMLFLSDIRSGKEEAGNFEEHVSENTKAQEAWVDIINPTYAMLKFRLPYRYTSRWSYEEKRQIRTLSSAPGESLHCGGPIVLPIWTRPTSTETRLVVPQYARKVLYDHQAYEDQCFFFNAVLRERAYFDHCVHGHKYLDHRYDGAAEVAVLQRYLEIYSAHRAAASIGATTNSAVLAAAVGNTSTSHKPVEDPTLASRIVSLADRITASIGGSFERAIANRSNIYLTKGQKAGWTDETEERIRKAAAMRDFPLWHRDLSEKERGTAQGMSPAKPVIWALAPLTVDPSTTIPASSASSSSTAGSQPAGPGPVGSTPAPTIVNATSSTVKGRGSLISLIHSGRSRR